MQRRSYIVMAAVIVGLALGIVLGPTMRSSVVSAQTQPPAQTEAAAPTNNLWTTFLDQLAAALNTDRSALDSAITSAGTSTADAAVQNGTLTQEQADQLKARIEAGDVGALFGGRGGRPGGPAMGGVQQAMLEAAAATLNISADELHQQLHAGQTLADLAQANGTSEQSVIDAALAAAKTQLDQLVTAGTLTQEQADARYAELQQRGADLLARPGGFGPHDAPDMPDPSATPSASPSA